MKISEARSECLSRIAPLHEAESIRKSLGTALRPGGFALIERVLSLHSFPAGAVLLDVGCGFGATAAHLQRNRNHMTIGMDISAKMLIEAGSLHSKIPLVRGCARHLPFRRGSCDGVICECVLSLIAEKQQVLREFHRVLRPGGLLIISDIYSREETENRGKNGLPVACHSGDAFVTSPVESLLKETGFEIPLFEDHSYLLRELAARLIFECGSLDAFWSEVSDGLNCRDVKSIFCGGRPGYYLLVARKD